MLSSSWRSRPTPNLTTPTPTPTATPSPTPSPTPPQVKAGEQEAKRQHDLVNRRAKEYAVALKRAKKAELQLHAAQNLLPFLRRQAANPTPNP